MAVLGLVAVIILALTNLQALNQECAAAIHGQQAEAESLPITNVAAAPAQPFGELPGSSYPPLVVGELPGSSSPPDALPASIGVNVQQAPALPPPTPGLQSPTRIVVPSLGIDWPVVAGNSQKVEERGVGRQSGSANPGERGNMILSGHNDVFGEVFKDLEALKNGDEIHVFAGGRMFKYQVQPRNALSCRRSCPC